MIENRQVRRQNSDCSSCYYSVGKNERIQRVRSHAGQAECASLQKQKEEYKTSVDTCNKLMAQKKLPLFTNTAEPDSTQFCSQKLRVWHMQLQKKEKKEIKMCADSFKKRTVFLTFKVHLNRVFMKAEFK